MIHVRDVAEMSGLPFEVVAELPDAAMMELVRAINCRDSYIVGPYMDRMKAGR